MKNQTATIGSVLSGSQGLVTSGTGTLILTVANTYTGATTVNSGTLQISGANNGPEHQIHGVPSQSITEAPSALSVITTTSFILLSPRPRLTYAGGLLTITAANTAHLGALALAGGTLEVHGHAWRKRRAVWNL